MQDAIGIAGMLRRREVSAREVVSAHIARIEAFDPVINAIVTRTFDAAPDRAAAADDEMASGRAVGLLHGLPVAHKDLADTAGVRTTYGSPLFAKNVPQRDALVVQRMAQAGARLDKRQRRAHPPESCSACRRLPALLRRRWPVSSSASGA